MSITTNSRTSFTIPLSDTKSTEVLITEPALRAEGLSLTTWTSAYIMACLMHKLSLPDLKKDSNADDKNIPVLELGAGTGLVGMTAAQLYRSDVILTDLEPIVSGLRSNIDLNLSALKSVSADVRCGSLDWNSPQTLTLENNEKTLSARETKAKLILAADTVYSEEHPVLLSQSVLAWLAPGPESRAVITYAMRVAYLDQIRELWELLEAGGLVAEAEGREEARADEWDDECLIEWTVWKWNDTKTA